MWSVLLSACANVHTSGEAPFDMPSVQASLWSVGDEADDQYASAMLVLSSSKSLGCEQLGGETLWDALDQVAADGSGLLFLFDQFGESDDLTGIWTEDGAFQPSEDGGDPNEGRYTFFYAFEDGYYYELYDADTSWITIEEASDKKVTGEFRSSWWRGSFRAEPCPSWEVEAPQTTTTTF